LIPVELGSEAEADLDSIFAYSFETFGDEIAEAYRFDLKAPSRACPNILN